jgi:hypothetical protein
MTKGKKKGKGVVSFSNFGVFPQKSTGVGDIMGNTSYLKRR